MWLGTLSLGFRVLESNSEIQPPPPGQGSEALCLRRHSKAGADTEPGPLDSQPLTFAGLRAPGWGLALGEGR